MLYLGQDINPWGFDPHSGFAGKGFGKSIEASDELTGMVLKKAAFWQQNALLITNATQRDIINRLFDGFKGNLTSGKAAKIYKVSQDTAARLLKDLVDRGFLKVQGGGRSTHYTL